MIIDLRVADLRKVKVGTVVITSKGFKFELVKRTKKGKESWKDLNTGITWLDREDENYTHYQAIEKFKNKLPSKEEFELAELHGFREILPNIHYYFWSSSVVSKYDDFAWGLYGNNGVINDYNRSYYDSVRCVARK